MCGFPQCTDEAYKSQLVNVAGEVRAHMLDRELVGLDFCGLSLLTR